MKRIALVAAIALIPLSVYAYLAHHSNSYDDYQAFNQQFHNEPSELHQNQMYHHRDAHFGEFRHHQSYPNEEHHQEQGTENTGEGKS